MCEGKATINFNLIFLQFNQHSVIPITWNICLISQMSTTSDYCKSVTHVIFNKKFGSEFGYLSFGFHEKYTILVTLSGYEVNISILVYSIMHIHQTMMTQIHNGTTGYRKNILWKSQKLVKNNKWLSSWLSTVLSIQ